MRQGHTRLLESVVVGLVACVAVPVSFGQPTTPAQAVQDARSMPRPDPRTVITAPNASTSIPHYGADVTEHTVLFQGGAGQLGPPGVLRVDDCLGRTDPECIAVQLVATGRTTRPSFTINPSDPLISGADFIRRNPGPVAGPNPGGLDPVTTACVTTDETLPATYVDETCDIITPAAENTCRVVWDIVVDADANYRCEASPHQLAPYSCNKTLQVEVTVGPPTCVPDTFAITHPRAPTFYWSPAVDKFIHVEAGYYCDIDRADGVLGIWYGAGTDGAYEGQYTSAELVIDPAQPTVAGSPPIFVGVVYTKYAIPIEVYYTTTDNPPTANQWNVRLYFFTSIGGSPAFPPTGISCPSGGVDGSRVMLYDPVTDSYSIHGDPYQCYVDGSGAQFALVDGGIYWYSVSSYPASTTGWSVRANDARVVDMLFDRPTYSVTITDNWINGCSALEARQ